ncbi:hypothetical protein COCC4DRAFT_131194 [Bipolaris maydis ATCC 48331]|uniref:Uncharacterized protein n=2 Tax=Cochliobolus heterostrophus TaxID=5016 RepID=M2UXP5_COCH5|nr:uncharacterized protein COCC4DRAFT_131194 [Bipolaris maydis ATCC 48331]EMD92598.1 hypothetical protein COCHEDRAFT_1213641 [Bipolaris maydis C5]ENI08294.1 hypothetical protein COCC4DRAFT_131194 [Bipolaris maydis ATCC 48331]
MHFLTGVEDGPGEYCPMTPSKVAELLPLSLKRLNLFVEFADMEDEFEEILDSEEDLWHLLEACKASLQNLSEITVTGNGDIYGAGHIMDAFEQAGVRFEVITADSVGADSSTAFSLPFGSFGSTGVEGRDEDESSSPRSS